MDPLDYLSIRFHFGGEFHHDGTEWQYLGGTHGMSMVHLSKLSLEELKNNLADHVRCSDKALNNSTLHWKFPGLIRDGAMSSALVMLHDQKSVLEMAKHATDAGVMDIYSNIPDDFSQDDYAEEHQHHLEEEQELHGEDQQQHVQEQQNNPNADEHILEPEAWQYSNLYYQPSSSSAKLPVKRGSSHMQDKGKSHLDEDEEVHTESDGSSDSDYAIPPAESNSSASDDEVLELRKYAKELKDKVRKNMLREEEGKPCNVPEEYIVPETFNLDDSDGEDTPYFESDDDLSYDEGSDGEISEVRRRKTTHRVYDDSTDKPEFALGMAFRDSREFKQALVKYGLANFHHLRFPKDEKKRVSAECSWPGCPWSIYGSISSRSDWLLVVRYKNEHTCIPRRDNKLVTSTVIAKKYFRQIRHNPTWHVEHMQEAVLEDLLADVSLSQCKRAKKLVMEKLTDLTNGEYSRVYDYHLELVRSNPGSTVAVTLDPEIFDKPVFQRMYICLDACKKGFLAGCRRVVGLDGCFLKGSVSGQILCAIGRDSNNQMYPIAWATVEVESYDSWYWFLSFLQKDLQISNNGDGWVFISDQQKGLIRAVNEIVPEAEHRMCARHIYANWRKVHRDKKLQKMFWACAKSSDVTQFNYNRAKLAQKSVEGAKDILKTAPEHWSRAYFKLGSWCDSVENNLCESFNNAIMKARFFPVITTNEIIRKKVMVRIQENRDKSNSWPGTICPNVFKKLKLNIKRSGLCQVLWNGKEGFEVQEGVHRRYTVNLEAWKCSCRYWELVGLPCPHAISAIYTCGKKLDDYIAPCYSISEYNKIYDHVLQPVEGKENWPVADMPKPHPPPHRVMPGRKKTKRRREEGEKPQGNKLSKKGIRISCSVCGSFDHNKRKCLGNPNRDKKQKDNYKRAAQRARKKKQKESEINTQVPQPPKRTNNAVSSSSRAPPNPAKRAKKQAPPARSSSQQASQHTVDRRSRMRSQNRVGSSSQPAPGNSSSIHMQVPTTDRLQWLLTGER